MEDQDDIRLALALKQAREHQFDHVVRTANRTVLLLRGSTLKESQLRNVISVAGNVDSIEALLNFIRYQIARERGWREPQAFGERVISDIQTIVRDAARTAVTNAQAAIGGNSTPDAALVALAHRQLAELYLGYLNRAFVYCTKARDGYELLQQATEENADVTVQ